MKILQIVVEGNTGSTGTIAEAIGVLAMNQGWESYIAYGRYPRASKSNLIKIGNNIDLILHGIKTRLFDRHGYASKKATKALILKIDSIKPDIIHLHHLHGYYINIKLLFDYLLRSNVPIVWTFHDCWSFTGHCAYFDYIGCEKWKTECNRCPQKKEYPASFLFDRSRENYYNKKDLFNSVPNLTIVTVSNWLEELVKCSFLKRNKIITIHNGIDINVFKQKNNKEETKALYNVQKKFLILGVASPWCKRKGLSEIIEMSKYLKSDEVIILVGLNKRQIERLPNNIVGLLKTENKQELVDLYSAADVFINPTLEDNFPTTNIEALACGTPVITYNTGGSPEAISSQTGIVVEKSSIKGLLNAIEKIKISDAKQLENSCRERAIEKYSKDKQFLKYFELYLNLLNKK
ncbi:MAG: glycosyltransferase [Deltaproteobacteria bacterium]|nr:glycosyltransferase [Deltaproteobacteria bacterium]